MNDLRYYKFTWNVSDVGVIHVVSHRFKPIRTYKDAEDDGFSCCTFAVSINY